MNVDGAERGRRAAVLLMWAAALVSLALTALRLARSSDEALALSRVCDDAYYFTQWARNLAAGAGPSFDGREATDGVRPVWALSLVPIYAVFDDPGVALRATCLWGAVLHVAAFALLARLLARWITPLPCALAFAVFVLAPSQLAQGAGAMDWPMNALLQMLLLDAVARVLGRAAPGRAALVGVGALAGLNLLERPETFVLVVALALLYAWRRGLVRARVELAWIAGGALLVVVPFALASIATYGAFGSVAGELKVHACLPSLDARVFARSLALVLGRSALELASDLSLGRVAFVATAAWPTLIAALVLAAAALGFVRARRAAGAAATAASGALMSGATAPGTASSGPIEPDAAAQAAQDARRLVVIGVLGFALLHAATIAALLHRFLAYGRWYLAPQDLALCAIVALAFDGLARCGAGVAARALRRAAAVALCAVLGTAAWRSEIAPLSGGAGVTDGRMVLRVCAWLGEHLRAGDRVGANNAGALAYYSEHPVTNLDGLMNTHRYLRECVLEPDAGTRGLNLVRYLIRNEIRYLADPWDVALGDAVPSRTLGAAFGKFFRLELSLPARLEPVGDVNYQVYRFDLEAARAELVARGLWSDAAP